MTTNELIDASFIQKKAAKSLVPVSFPPSPHPITHYCRPSPPRSLPPGRPHNQSRKCPGSSPGCHPATFPPAGTVQLWAWPRSWLCGPARHHPVSCGRKYANSLVWLTAYCRQQHCVLKWLRFTLIQYQFIDALLVAFYAVKCQRHSIAIVALCLFLF